jgi:hypothetical protein
VMATAAIATKRNVFRIQIFRIIAVSLILREFAGSQSFQIRM